MQTTGNDDTHLVLRGGSRGPNFSAADVAAAAALLAHHRLPVQVMVDCSHANSGKDAGRQTAVAADLAGRIAAGDRSVAAVMVESNLVGGAQDYRAQPLVRGQSVTDACLSWEMTLPLLAGLAGAVQARRRAGA
jgi:3-deoxy-7-phosphoheptulonate synthase